MDKHLHGSQYLAPNVSCSSSTSSPLQFKKHANGPSETGEEQITSSLSIECCWQSKEMNSSEDNTEVPQTGGFEARQCLGNELDRKGQVAFNFEGDDMDQGLSCVDSHEKNFNKTFNVCDHNALAEQFVNVDSEEYVLKQRCTRPVLLESLGRNDNLVHSESIFPIGDSHQIEIEVQEDFGMHLSPVHVGDSGYHIIDSPDRIVNSCSLLDDEASQEDCILSKLSGGSYEVRDEERFCILGDEKHTSEYQFGDRCDSGNFNGFPRDWASSEMDEVAVKSDRQQESSVHMWDGLSNKEFNSKRIEDWINQIDLQSSSPLYEIGECSNSTPKSRKDACLIGGMIPAKFNGSMTLGMDMANRYISSLTTMSISAQMANLGLAVIPCLSACVSLRVLNLSGNTIVGIIGGSLPRGLRVLDLSKNNISVIEGLRELTYLHVLNLSKNNISTIEGLRELTCLRVLDLSHNRIFRIGHGLVSCSSLKEVYLAGNKISEVEGLHRLLKLNVLDLRFNKISTTKCLGQLAANYGSLQAINLEGNPALRNVGDEQKLKKYLAGLLPHLVYLNGQMIRGSSLKEIPDQLVRSITAHYFNPSLRSEHKLSRRAIHGASTHKSPSSSTHGRSSKARGSSNRQKSGMVSCLQADQKEPITRRKMVLQG
ncbi:hypothetical protein MRB53_022378 [Persea americana]|uniref:Uncharacterized protein n=1 Tax=Persea americana TaxID=3435 RepID=A0ACC2L6K1_PERAE|nr:hypothetical protein MRB53_022378 [Persea americana]